MYTSLPRGVARCQHIKVNGTRCDSPALKGKAYCYFHYRAHLHDAPVTPGANGQKLIAKSQEPIAVPPDLFLLEDANSIQCALQWVLRRILAASIDHRQASLLLYGLQIAAANIKFTRFEPSYGDVVRSLPAVETETNFSSCHLERAPIEQTRGESKTCPELAEGDLVSPPATSSQPAEAQPPDGDCQTQRSPLETTDSNNDCHPEFGPGEPAGAPNKPAVRLVGVEAPVRANGPAFSSPSAVPQTSSPAPKADSPTAYPDSRPLTTDSPKLSASLPRPRRSSRRAPTKPLATDNWQLATVKPALSQMFQREVRRHLARLNFPASPDTDSASET